MLTITDLKQFVYCPRVIYYTYVQPVPKKPTFKMVYGREQHTEMNKKEKRRGLIQYKLIEGERIFGYPIRSQELGLSGKLDILIDTKNELGQRYFPVECKDTDRGIFNNIKYQLVAYAMCLEEMTGSTVSEGFIYIIPEKKAYKIIITNEQKKYVRKMISMINKIINEEHYPEPRARKRCWDCEFIRYCNDHDISSQQEQKEKNLELVKQLFNTKERI
ncbi:CRISPR-associated protein Cas4 [Calidifontibacillus oryziterrae]|uniref:CRISPR-associated protein Cas4 n=1 Tax=Calidifontibacillus oryziterrae TaxID=1191699 RepID=UPI0002FA37D3|nr:CRISPR-associated protein Cas4 [Calidifontibacillus oryziterrae]